MKDKEKIISTIKSQGIIPLFYHEDLQTSIDVVDCLYNSGIRIIEYTNRGSKALDNFKMLLQKRNEQWPELILSVGTIKSVDDAKQYINAGADFIISPGMIPDIAKVVRDAGLLWVPGCMTPTEIMIAEQHGACLIKLFPGSMLRPSFVKAIKDIFPNLMFMPTGGVDISEANISAWFHAGVVAVGLGSKLLGKDLLKNKDFKTIGSLAEKALQIVQSVSQHAL